MSSISRREFVRLTGLTAAGTVLAACAETPAEPAAPAAPTTAPAAPTVPAEVSRFSEAPLLAEQVEAGALPPVEERLPVDPMIVPVVEEIGQYGGVWHRVAVGVNDVGIIDSRFTYECLIRFSADGTTLLPNIAKAYDINDEATEFTFYLREGMKWSDGEPFSAEEFVSWYEDGLLNEDLTPTFPKWLRDPANAEPMVLEKLDDYSFRITFGSPYGLFIQIVGGARGRSLTQWCAHYLRQFHPDHVPMEELQPMIDEAGFDNWWELFGDRRSWQNADRPCVYAWVPTRVPPDVPVVCERNPYYAKVDPEGHQLPYIDSVHFDIVENADLLNMKAAAGEMDMQFRHVAWDNYPILVDNAEKGDYRVMKWTLAEGSNCCLHPNMNHKDPGLRELMQNRDFRIALSLGIDRAAINELAYQGFGEPRQAALIPQCPYYKEEHAQRYAEHDPDQANELLDGIGLTERDADGFRMRLDGEPLTITIEYPPIFGPWGDSVEMIADQWKMIGIRAVPKEEDRTLFSQRGMAGEEMDMGVWMMDRCFTPLLEPWFFFPYLGGTPPSTAAKWYQWYTTGGAEGEEPPEEVQAQYALYDKIKGAPPDQLPALAEEFFERASENIWFIGTVGGLPDVGIVKNSFRNVPDDAISDWLVLSPASTALEQYFWKQ